MKVQNEDNIRNVHQKNEELEKLMDQLDVLGEIIEKKDNQIVDLNSTIMLLEMKNRKMSEVVNKAIHSVSGNQIGDTMDVLNRRGGDPRLEAMMEELKNDEND